MSSRCCYSAWLRRRLRRGGWGKGNLTFSFIDFVKKYLAVVRGTYILNVEILLLLFQWDTYFLLLNFCDLKKLVCTPGAPAGDEHNSPISGRSDCVHQAARARHPHQGSDQRHGHRFQVRSNIRSASFGVPYPFWVRFRKLDPECAQRVLKIFTKLKKCQIASKNV